MRDGAKTYDELVGELEQTQKALSELKAVTFYPAPTPGDDAFRDVFRASPDILLLLTPDLRMVDASDARLNATGTRREEIEGRYLFDVFPDNPENQESAGKNALRASLTRVLQTGKPHEMALQRYDLQRPDGSFEVRYWRPLNVPVLGPDGRVRYIVHRVEDATDELRLLADRTRELKDQQALTWRIIDTAPIGIAFYDENLVVRYFNRTLAKLLNVRVEDVVDRFVGDAFPQLDPAAIAHQYGQVLRTGVAYIERGRPVVERDDHGVEQTTYWDFKNLPVRGPDGRVIEIFGVAIDVTGRIHNEELQRERIETLEQVDRYKDQFLGILSHELRTPINGIMGFGSILADGLAGELEPTQKHYVAKILECSESLLRLVNDLLDMSRVQAGKFALDVQTVALAPVIRNTLATLAPEAIKKGHSLVNLVPASLPALRADPVRVGQIVSNLVINAIKYTPDGGTITVRACADGTALRVEVIDTGIGITPEQHASIFQAFTQVDMSNTRTTGGVGLGLSIVKGLVEAHGGQAGVESEGRGKGSTFWFTLPLAQG